MKKIILVIDVPASATAEEAEQILNKPFEEGYYLERLQPKGGDLSARAFFKLRTKTAAKEGRR